MESIKKLAKSLKIRPDELIDDFLNPLEENLLRILRANKKVYNQVLKNPDIIIKHFEKE